MPKIHLYIGYNIVTNKIDKIMDEKTYDEFISAVDVVCGNCIERSEDMCENCPVRHSVDYFNKK